MAKNFKDHNGNETSEWMAHYIAEKMTAIESAHGKARSSAQRECFEAILLLWEHQSYFPNDMRPFEDFEPVFRALTHIDPNTQTPSYFRNGNENKQTPKDIEQYITFISNLDAATRIMVSFFVREAILNVADESTLQWLDAIKGVAISNEAQVIFKAAQELDVKDIDEAQVKKVSRVKELSEHIDRLDAFESLSQNIRTILKAELKNLKDG